MEVADDHSHGLFVPTRGGQPVWSRPRSGSITNNLELSDMYGSWLESAREVREAQRQQVRVQVQRDFESSVARTRSDSTTPMPAQAKPPKSLPWLIMKTYTTALCFTWGVGLIHHIVRCGLRHPGDVLSPPPPMQRVLASWPEPGRFFDISGLYCNTSHIIFSSEFSLHAAERLSDMEVGPLSEVGDLGQAAVHCQIDGCHALSLVEKELHWLSTPLKPPFGTDHVAEQLPVPSTWLLATVTWVPCTIPGCRHAWVAGWDGEKKVIVATLRRDSPSDGWHFKRRFSLKSGGGRCTGAGRRVACRPKLQEVFIYDDVRALHFGIGGENLLVLSGSGRLDAWDLRSGTQLRQWTLNGRPTALCYDGRMLFLARPGSDGPVLEFGTFSFPNEPVESGLLAGDWGPWMTGLIQRV